MKKYFLTGLATLLPLTITLLIAYFIIDFLTRPFVGLIEDLFKYYGPYLGKLAAHTGLMLWISRLIALTLLIVSIFLLGFLVRKLFLHYLVELTHKIFLRIPVLRTIYKTTKQIADLVLDQKEKFFKKTVLMKFPNTKSCALAFQMAKPPRSVEEKLSPSEWQTLFVPTAPHPISGFLLIADERDVKEVDISPEDVFKFLISCGIYHPNEKS